MLRRIGKLRLPFSYVMALLLIVFANKPLVIWGLVFVVAGVATRFWAAGHIVKSRNLSKSGPYAFTRNPLYLGSFLSALGTAIMVHNWWLLGIFLAGFAVFYGCTIRSEEEFLGGRYGEEFALYKKRVPIFFPRLIPDGTVRESKFSWQRAIRNGEYKSFICTVVVIGLIFAVAHIKSGM